MTPRNAAREKDAAASADVAGSLLRRLDPRWLVIVVRLGSALVFVVFGIGKFTNHASELASFQGYGLPHPDAFVYAVGVVEVVGGVLLAIGRAIRAAALVLAGDMVGAIVVSGIARGETVSLTLAPVLLVAMLFLLLAPRIQHSGSKSAPRAPGTDPST
jgi:putative oxidoreductase